MIGLFVRPQTQRERNVVRFSAAVSGEERCVTTLKTAVWQTTECFAFFYIMSTVISLFVTVMNHSYISVSELPFFHIHVRLHLKIQTELYAFT